MVRRSFLTGTTIGILILSFLVAPVVLVSLSFDYSNMILPFDFKLKCAQLGGEVILDDTCYYSAPSNLGFQAAKDFCQADNAHLLSLNTIEERASLIKKGHLVTNTWLSLEDVSGGKFTWSDGFVSLEDSRIMNLSAEVSSPVGCSIYGDGLVTSAACTETHATICKLRYFLKCYPGWAYEEQTDKCYRIFGTSKDPDTPNFEQKSASDAVQFCNQYEDGHLVSTFAGSFFISWHPFWNFLGTSWEAWVGIFYSPVSPTKFVDDVGAILSPISFWLKYQNQPELFNCTFYNKTEQANIQDTRLCPGEDCSANKLFMCEIGAHTGKYPSIPEEPKPNKTNPHYRSEIYQVVKDRRLLNHVIRSLPVRSKTVCAMNCLAMEGACLSFNLYPQGGNLPYVCELNNSEDESDLTVLSPNSENFYCKQYLY